MTQSIPVFSVDSRFVRMASEGEACAMLAADTHTLVRDRAGNSRRLYERAVEDAPLKGSAKRQAAASYAGTVKFTYIEKLAVPSHLCMLKRVGRDKHGTETGEYVRW